MVYRSRVEYDRAMAQWHRDQRNGIASPHPEYVPPDGAAETTSRRDPGSHVYRDIADYYEAHARWGEKMLSLRAGEIPPPEPRRPPGRPRIVNGGTVVAMAFPRWVDERLRRYAQEHDLGLGEALSEMHARRPASLPELLHPDPPNELPVRTTMSVSQELARELAQMRPRERRDLVSRLVQFHAGGPSEIPLVVCLDHRIVAALDEVRGETPREVALARALEAALGLGGAS